MFDRVLNTYLKLEISCKISPFVTHNNFFLPVAGPTSFFEWEEGTFGNVGNTFPLTGDGKNVSFNFKSFVVVAQSFSQSQVVQEIRKLHFLTIEL